MCMEFSDLAEKIKSYEKKPNLSLIEKAYKFAEKAHNGQKRESGELFIQHPLNVAYILAELKLDDTTIAVALLHDVVEDTEVTNLDLLNNFGKEIASLVDAVTKIKSLKNLSREDYHAETLRKVILASIKDVRVILIKLADRLHNMRTIGVFREEKRKRIAKDVLEIYAPIAHKLGISKIKLELEDLAFQQLEPEIYNDLRDKIKQSQKEREKEVEELIKCLLAELKKSKIPAKIEWRSKHIYSVYKKMQKNHCSFGEIYDLMALRVITDSVRHCYEILGILHNLWAPIPEKFKDYIATPKINMYQSLHTVVVCPKKKPIEVQIRTDEMHEVAEKGIATHWAYKGFANEKEFDQKFKWMMELNELQNGSEDAKDFLKMLNIDLFEDEIYVFTPKGKVIQLPKGASIVDFAYAVHSDLGDKCIAAKVNGLFVPLRYNLNNGDMVEIITSKNQHPSRDWLKFVTTSKAMNKVKHYLSLIKKPANKLKIIDEKKELEEWIIDVDNTRRPEILLSKCCHPTPGNKIVGYAKSVNKVAIHSADCSLVKKGKIKEKKKVNVKWLDNIGNRVEIKVEAKERTGLFVEILNVLIALNMPIKGTKAKTLSNDIVECSFVVETSGLMHLQNLITRIKKIKGVKNVFIGNMSR